MTSHPSTLTRLPVAFRQLQVIHSQRLTPRI